MFSAYDKNGRLLHLLKNQPDPQEDYVCPACRGPLRLKKGQVIQPHFAHISLANCHYSNENESREHLNLKAALYRWGKQAVTTEVEAFLPELQQVADVLLAGKIALEVQCSPLSQERLAERTRNYQRAGYQVLWLLGEKLWLKQFLRPLQKHFLYFSQNMGFHLWELDEKKQLLRLKYLIHEDLHGRAQYLEKAFPFEEENLLDILRQPFQKQAVTSFLAKSDRDICCYVRQQLYYQQPKWMKLQEEHYQKGENLLEKRAEDFYPQVQPVQSKQGFCQIRQDLSGYYENFQSYYQKEANKKQQILYPPAFYARILH